MNPVLIIQQFFGLGDVIWGQTIANDYVKDGFKVLWPVRAEWVSSLRVAYPNIEFIDHELIPVDYNNRRLYTDKTFTYLPMRFSEYLMGKPYKFHMESKYSFLGKDWHRWREGAAFVRDLRKEEKLKHEIGLWDNQRYNFIATEFGSNGTGQVEIKIDNGYKNIYLQRVEGYSLFDWAGVIQGAEIIHAVSSSTLYLFEILPMHAKEIHLYCRKPVETNFDYVSFLFTKDYILHY